MQCGRVRVPIHAHPCLEHATRAPTRPLMAANLLLRFSPQQLHRCGSQHRRLRVYSKRKQDPTARHQACGRDYGEGGHPHHAQAPGRSHPDAGGSVASARGDPRGDPGDHGFSTKHQGQ